MRRWDPTHGVEEDPLIKVGAGAMVLALGFAIVVAVAASLDRPMEPAAAKQEVKSTTEPLVRSDPGVDPWVEKDIPQPRPKIITRPSPPAEPPLDPNPDPPKPGFRFGESGNQSPNALPLDEYDFPLPTNNQIRATNNPRRYHLPQGATMSLTIRSIGLKNVPVLDSEAPRALDMGVVHLPDTSLPWSDTPERNVYLAGHRLGWPGTGSHRIFYRLDELTGGEKVTLRGPNGKTYTYRVLNNFIVGPRAHWVTGRIRDRDLLTLQTCTPIPTFQNRLIVRAERI